MKIKVINWCRRLADYPDPFEYRSGYVFTNDAACRDYDWLVVYDELKNPYEDLACPHERTILATCEPTSIKSYSRAFTRQFGHLLTNRPPSAEAHPHYHLGRGYYQGFTGRSYPEDASAVLPPKTKTISAVCSSKCMRHTRHYDRVRLIRALSQALPELEWFGHGVRDFARKCEVMDGYKYHVAVENHIAPHHWTEKLSDAFLCECLPFYAGAPDLAEDFPAESFITIPIDDPAEAVRIVTEAIRAGEYEKRRDAILEAKRLILKKYNFWEQVVGVIEAADAAADGPSQRIYSSKALRCRNLGAALEDGWAHVKRAAGGIFRQWR